MDYIGMVERGEYRESDLTAEQSEYIRGLRAAIERVDALLEANGGRGGEPLLDLLLYEIRRGALQELGGILRGDVCRAIVAFGEHNRERGVTGDAHRDG